MAWYDSFAGHAERIDMSKAGSNGGNFAKAFGDAFAKIGENATDAATRAKKDQLTGLQIQNEQMKIDSATAAAGQKKLDDAYRGDTSLLDLDTSVEAKQNAVDALQTFYKPSSEARTAQANEMKIEENAIQAKNNDEYKRLYMSAPNKEELRDAYALSPLGDKGYMAPADIAKERDAFYQTKFNDEAIETSTSGGYKNMDAFVKANPELVKNADGVTMSKIETHFATKDKDAYDRTDKDRNFNLKEKEFKHKVNNDAASLEVERIKAKKSGSGEGGSRQEKDSKVVDAINKIIVTKYGKIDPNGNVFMDDGSRAKADWLGTRALHYASNGNDASVSYVQAERDYNALSKQKAKTSPQTTDPLGLKK